MRGWHRTNPSAFQLVKITIYVTAFSYTEIMKLTFEQLKLIKTYLFELAKAYFISGFLSDLMRLDLPIVINLVYKFSCLGMSLLLLYLSLRVSLLHRRSNA
jgi:hypothetical protein